MSPIVTKKWIGYTDSQDELETDAVWAWKLIEELSDKRLEIEKKSLKDFLANFIFIVPRFQREYSWKNENIEDFWDVLFRIFEADPASEAKIPECFFGAMFFLQDSKKEKEKEIIIIDGQQRIATVSIMLKILLSELETLKEETTFPRGIDDEIYTLRNFLYRGIEPGVKKRSSLILNKINRDFFEALMLGPENLIDYIRNQNKVHSLKKYNAIKIKIFVKKLNIPKDLVETEEINIDDNKEFHYSNELIMNAYDILYKKMKEKIKEFEDPKEKVYFLGNLSRYLLNSFKIGYFRLSLRDYVHIMELFRSLNDTGADLTVIDLIKLYICLKLVEADKKTQEKYIDYWEDVISFFGDYGIVKEFLIDYITVFKEGSKRIREKELLKEVHNIYLKDLESTKKFLEKIKEHSKYYNDILEQDLQLNDEDLTKSCNSILIRLDKLRIKQGRSLIFGAYSEIMIKGNAKKEKYFYELLKVIESLSLRLSISSVSPAIYEKIYAGMCNIFLGEGLNEKTSKTLIEKFEDKLSGQIFVKAILEILLTNKWKNKQAKQIFRKLITEDFQKTKKEIITIRQLNLDDSIVQLEHIFPVKPIFDKGDKFAWIKNFFFFDDNSQLQDYEKNLQKILEKLIKNKDEESLEEIAEEFILDIGNLLLLHQIKNIVLQNKLFSEKIEKYHQTKDFEDIIINKNFFKENLNPKKLEKLKRYVKLKEKLETLNKENWKETLKELEISAKNFKEAKLELQKEIKELEKIKSFFDKFWNYKEMAKRKTYLVKLICDSIKLRDREFSGIDIDQEVEVKERERIEIINVKYRRLLEE